MIGWKLTETRLQTRLASAKKRRRGRVLPGREVATMPRIHLLLAILEGGCRYKDDNPVLLCQKSPPANEEYIETTSRTLDDCIYQHRLAWGMI